MLKRLLHVFGSLMLCVPVAAQGQAVDATAAAAVAAPRAWVLARCAATAAHVCLSVARPVETYDAYLHPFRRVATTPRPADADHGSSTGTCMVYRAPGRSTVGEPYDPQLISHGE